MVKQCVDAFLMVVEGVEPVQVGAHWLQRFVVSEATYLIDHFPVVSDFLNGGRGFIDGHFS